MTDVSYPGVYVEEVSSGARPITAASTSRPVFVGETEQENSNPKLVARLITSWNDYQRIYGGFSPGNGYLAHSVFQFFNNGGRSCYVLRALGTDAAAATTTVPNAEVTSPSNVVKFSAKSEGTAGNNLYISIAAGTTRPNDTVCATLRQWVSGSSTVPLFDQPPVETHDNLSMDPSSDRYLPDILDLNSGLIGAQDIKQVPLATLKYVGAWVKSEDWPAAAGSFRLVINGISTVVNVVAADPTHATTIDTRVTGLPSGTTSHVSVETNADDAQLQRLVFTIAEAPGTAAPYLQILALSTESSSNSYAKSLGLGSGTASFEVSPYRTRLPELTKPANAHSMPSEAEFAHQLDGGKNGTLGNVFGSNPAVRKALDKLTDASLLVLPGITGQYDDAVGYCESRPLRDMFFIGDIEDPTDNKDSVAFATAKMNGLKANGMGALYFPWVIARNPMGGTETITLPPSGFVAGIFARIDQTRGVWKAPAGLEASLTGALGLTDYLTDEEQGPLNLAGLNVLRKFDVGGLVVWGARTITSDKRQIYVSVRRVQSMLQRSVYNSLQNVVFEPNNENLWSSLKADVGGFMNSLFREGAFQGETARQAYFVRCGLGETMVQTDIDNGKVIVEVGFAALKPAEFVIVRVQHSMGQA